MEVFGLSGKAKNLSNQRKHGVSFEEASQVFRDPLYVSVQDRVEGGELRWQVLGLVKDLLLLTVAHTVRKERDEGTDYDKSVDVIRIIISSTRDSEREATL